MNTAGWLLTESGRQPWIVQGLMKTANADSPSVSATEIGISLAAFVLVYIALGAVKVVLMTRYARKGLEPEGGDGGESAPLPAVRWRAWPVWVAPRFPR